MKNVVIKLSTIVLYILLVSTFLSFGSKYLLLFWLVLGALALAYDIKNEFLNDIHRIKRVIAWKKLKKKGDKLSEKKRKKLEKICYG